MAHSSVEVMKAMCVGVFITAAKQIHSEDTDGVLMSWDFALTQWELVEGLTGF